MKLRRMAAGAAVVCSWGMAGASVHGSAPAHATQAQARAHAEVIELENEWLQALNQADVNTIAGILSDDFVRPAPESGQFISKQELLGYYRSHLTPGSPEQKRIENMTVRVYGDSAIARGQVVTLDGRGKTVSTVLFTDVFLRRKGRWQAVSAQENPVTAR